MKSTARIPAGIRLAAVLCGLLMLAPGVKAEEVKSLLSLPNVEIWEIREPNVKQLVTEYRQITFRPGDIVTVTAEGCVQTGGWGRTWKRYVDPQGPNSHVLYHGLIGIPGATRGMERIQNLAPEWLGVPGKYRGKLVIPPNVDPQGLFLRLGFEDDGYGDNGYWGRDSFWTGRDDGTGSQCRGLDNARVTVAIFRL